MILYKNLSLVHIQQTQSWFQPPEIYRLSPYCVVPEISTTEGHWKFREEGGS